jgi:hypothetical protein
MDPKQDTGVPVPVPTTALRSACRDYKNFALDATVHKLQFYVYDQHKFE